MKFSFPNSIGKNLLIASILFISFSRPLCAMNPSELLAGNPLCTLSARQVGFAALGFGLGGGLFRAIEDYCWAMGSHSEHLQIVARRPNVHSAADGDKNVLDAHCEVEKNYFIRRIIGCRGAAYTCNGLALACTLRWLWLLAKR